jgi:hypothetical protein
MTRNRGGRISVASSTGRSASAAGFIRSLWNAPATFSATALPPNSSASAAAASHAALSPEITI